MGWEGQIFKVPRNEGRVPTVEEYLDENKALTGEDVWPLERAKSDPNVPWDMQTWLFEELADGATGKLEEMIGPFRSEIIELARKRLQDGFAEYGSRMYGWTPEERLQNALEELADCVVYLTSGRLP